VPKFAQEVSFVDFRRNWQLECPIRPIQAGRSLAADSLRATCTGKSFLAVPRPSGVLSTNQHVTRRPVHKRISTVNIVY
jgi:hypothetical protein